MRTRLPAMFACFFLAVAASPALCAEDKKEQSLRSCLWEVERTMVLYRAIRENGYGGKLETDMQLELSRMVQGSAQRKAAEAHMSQLQKQQGKHEGDIEDKLLQQCMAAGGYRYDYIAGTKDVTCAIRPELSGSVLVRAAHCWEPIQ